MERVGWNIWLIRRWQLSGRLDLHGLIVAGQLALARLGAENGGLADAALVPFAKLVSHQELPLLRIKGLAVACDRGVSASGNNEFCTANAAHKPIPGTDLRHALRLVPQLM